MNKENDINGRNNVTTIMSNGSIYLHSTIFCKIRYSKFIKCASTSVIYDGNQDTPWEGCY